MSENFESGTSLVKAGEDAFRLSTNAAGLCAEIVKRTAVSIQGRRFVSVEGWQSIAIAHGCIASSGEVEVVPGGVRALGFVRRMSDGALLAQAEGFVGEDETAWFGGTDARGRRLPPRPMFAIRAMAQTRAISRACRSAFAHVVVLIDAEISTTPAEEMASLHPVIEHVADNAQPERSSPTNQSPARAAALRRLYAVMREANLLTDDRSKNKERAAILAQRYLQTEQPVTSLHDLSLQDIHDLASCISDDPSLAVEILQETNS